MAHEPINRRLFKQFRPGFARAEPGFIRRFGLRQPPGFARRLNGLDRFEHVKQRIVILTPYLHAGAGIQQTLQ